MIERFYEPVNGEILFDDINLKDIKLKTPNIKLTTMIYNEL